MLGELALFGAWMHARHGNTPKGDKDDDSELLIAILLVPVIAMICAPAILYAAIRDSGMGWRASAGAAMLITSAGVLAAARTSWWYLPAGALVVGLVSLAVVIVQAYRRDRREHLKETGESVPTWRFS